MSESVQLAAQGVGARRAASEPPTGEGAGTNMREPVEVVANVLFICVSDHGSPRDLTAGSSLIGLRSAPQWPRGRAVRQGRWL